MFQSDWLILSILNQSFVIERPKGRVTSVADEIAETHPDTNIKVAAFTVSEKSSNIVYVQTPHLNAHADISSKPRGLKFSMSL